MTKILIVVNELLNTCGVSKHLFYFLREMKDQIEFEFSILCGGGDAVDTYRDLCKEIIVDEKIKHESRSYYNYFISVLNLYWLIKRNKYDIIHSHNHYAANICHYACYFNQTKDMQTIHGVLPEIGKLNHFSGEYIVCVNEHILDYIMNNKIKRKERVKLIRCAVSSVEPLIKNKNFKLKIIAASRIIPEKGMDIYIKAICQLPESVKKNAIFLIAGKGPYEEQLKNLNNKLNANVKFLGEIENLLEFLKTTDIFIFPTISDTEGLPLTLIESALTKNLIISSRYHGINPIFSEALGPFLFDKGNTQQLSKKIQYSIENYSQCQIIIETLYKRIKNEYSINNMITNLTQFYRTAAL
jgi:glycosyltransferase involved in cell wall biosynthesis